MSAILKAILKLCDIDDQKKGEERQDFLRRCVKGINALDDKEYNSLGKPAEAWFNDAADVIESNKKKDTDKPLPDFPDLEEDKPTASTRRRSSEDDGDDKGTTKRSAKKDDDEPAVVKLGMIVTVVKTNGRELTGKLVERDKSVVVVVVDGKEKEVDMEDVKTIEVFNDGAGKDKKKDEDDAPRDPQVGDTISFTTKRGRKVEGVLVEDKDDEFVVKTDEGEEDFTKARIEGGAKVVSGGKKAPKDEGDDKATSKPAAKGKKDDDAGDEGEKKSRSNNGGVSIGMRIKELIVENLDADQAGIKKLLDKEKLEYRDNTLALAFNDAHKLLDLLKSRKMLKA